MSRPYRFVTAAERNEMRDLYAAHGDYMFVALAFDRDVDTVRRHVATRRKVQSKAIAAKADERARTIVAEYDASKTVHRHIIAERLGFKNVKILSVFVCRARHRLAELQARQTA